MEGSQNFLFGNYLQTDVEQEKEETTDTSKQEDTASKEETGTAADYLQTTLTRMQEKINQLNNTRLNTGTQERQLMTIRQKCLDFLIELLFPSRIKANAGNGYGSATDSQSSGSETTIADMLTAAQGGGSTVTNSVDIGTVQMRTLSFTNVYYHQETETTSFSTQGTVKCADGRELTFNLNLEMSQSFTEYYEETYKTLDVAMMCDPLVINLEGNIAELSDQTFLFDIDADGELDEISQLDGKSGYLALDKNGDDEINDGSELFGTASGNGFADLAKYDSDGNGWIDEADEIWDKLKIWQVGEDGYSRLYSLSEKGVGAICLQNAATDYTLKGENGKAQGMIRNSGVFLYENGIAGSVQHVDVAKYNKVS